MRRQGHPKAALGGVLHRLVVVMGDQYLAGHGRWPHCSGSGRSSRIATAHSCGAGTSIRGQPVPQPWPARATAVASMAPQLWWAPMLPTDLYAPQRPA